MINTDVNEIKKTIKLIQQDIVTDEMKELRKENRFEYIYQLFKKYPEFSEKHPTLLKKVANFEDLTHLNTMLNNIEAIQQKKISKHQAEVDMGNELSKLYFKNIN